MKALVIGSNGMLGHKLVQVLAADHDLNVVAMHRSSPDQRFIADRARYLCMSDIRASSDEVLKLIVQERPNVIINAVGVVKQQPAIAQVERTLWLNGLWPHLLADCATKINAKLVQISTDCVFSGATGHYADNDALSPIDLYGRSKAMGEVDYDSHLTLRTSIVGFERVGFTGLLSWLLKQPHGTTVPGYSSAIFSGLPTVVLSEVIRDIIKSGKKITGIHNVASEPISKFQLLSLLNKKLDLNLQITADSTLKIDRSLEGAKFAAAASFRCPSWDDLTTRLVEDFKRWPYDEVYKDQTISRAMKAK